MASSAPVEFVVYSEDSSLVQLNFDTWVPRSHFIVLQKTSERDATEEDRRAAFEIIGRFLADNPEFDVDAILSFHCGQWYQRHTRWHAHLCVPLEPYLRRAVNQVNKIFF